MLRRGSPIRFVAYLVCLVTTSMKAEKFQKSSCQVEDDFEKSVLRHRGRPRVARGCPVEGRRPDCLHFYKAKCDGQNRCIFIVRAGTFAHNPLQKCRRYVLRTAKACPKDRAASFPFQRPPWVLARAPGKCFANPRWPRRWPPARITAFLRCPVASSKRAEKFQKKTS